MTEYLTLVAAAGVLTGMILAAMVLLEHKSFWTVCIRLPGQLYKDLKAAARRHGWALTTEILDRLMKSIEEGRS